MKLKVGELFKKAKPFVRTSISLAKAGQKFSTGDVKGTLTQLKKINKRGDLKSMLHTTSDIVQARKKRKIKSDSGISKSLQAKNKKSVIFNENDNKYIDDTHNIFLTRDESSQNTGRDNYQSSDYGASSFSDVTPYRRVREFIPDDFGDDY